MLRPRSKLTIGSVLAFILSAALVAFGQGQGEKSNRFDDDSRFAPSSRFDRETEDDERSARGANAADFDYYALVLSWSPTFCSGSQAGADDALQCERRDGKRYSFVLHGLWPQYERGYPANCRVPGGDRVPGAVIDQMLDIMPSPGLVKHQYRKHGTCSGLKAGEFFDLARASYQRVVVPKRFQNPFETQFLSPDEVADEFIAANPGLKENMIGVACGGPGDRLREVRICLTKTGGFRPCGENERQGKLCRSQRVSVPPVRSTK